MHLGNGIICPITGIPMLAIAGVSAIWALKKARKDFKKENIPQTAALTAFVFALQMINFTIPSTGSSGHIIGAVLLSALLGPYAAFLGPYAAFLAMCAILTVQAVFFADGGLMALGCNMFNMGFLACFVVYPLVYKPLVDNKKYALGAFLSSVAALQLGSVAVVTEAYLSGSITSNIASFAALMQGIHLAIGAAEGLFTAAVVYAVMNGKIRQSVLTSVFSVSALVIGAFLAQYASQKPDGLEWSLLKMSDSMVMQTQGILYSISESIQAKTAVLAQIQPIAANISGIIITALLMAAVGYMLSYKTVEIYE